MTHNDTDTDNRFECGECGDTFGTERGRESHVEQVHGRDYHDESLLRRLYVDRGLSSMELAERFDISDSSVRSLLRRFGIEVRSTKESHRRKSPDELTDSETLEALYHERGLTDAEIAERVGVAQGTVSRWRSIHGIEARDPPTGKEHWRWVEDTNAPYYGANWEAQSQKARERDGHTCQVCGADSSADVYLDVHHIRPLKSFDTPEDANTLDNLITLCRPCHRKWEGIPLRPEPVP